MNIANLIVNIFVAIGTIGAVVVSLYLNYANQRPKLKIVKIETEDNNNLYYALQIFNNGSFEPIINQLGFSNKKEVHWQKLGDLNGKYKKTFMTDNMLDEVVDYHFPVRLKSGEMIGILLNRDEMLSLKSNMRFNRIKLKLIFIDETRLTIKLTKKEVNKYLEDSYLFDRK